MTSKESDVLSSSGFVPVEKTDLGDFEMIDEVDATLSPEDAMREGTKTLKKARQVMNTGPIEEALLKIINQGEIIKTTIPKEINATPYKDLAGITKLPSDTKREIRTQRMNIAMMTAQCDEPMKKRSRFLAAFNPEEYKDAIKICQAFTPLLKKYEEILEKMFLGELQYLRNFYKIISDMDVLKNKLHIHGGRKSKKTRKIRKGKKTRKTKKAKKNRKITRRRRGGLQASERTKLIMSVNSILKKETSKKFYDCIVENKVVQEFVDMAIRRGWNYTPGELVGIIISDNTSCDI